MDDNDWLNFMPLKRRKVEVVTNCKPKSRKKNVSSNKNNNNDNDKKMKCLETKTVRIVVETRCPICQFTFDRQIPNSHVEECIERKWDDINECPKGRECDSTLESHFREFTHFHLAQMRSSSALGNDAISLLLSSSSQKENYETVNDESTIVTPTKRKSKVQCDIRSFLEKKITKNVGIGVVEKGENLKKMDDVKKVDETQPEKVDVVDKKEEKNGDERKIDELKREEKKNGRKTTRKKDCPFYKKIPDTFIAVDAFSYGEIDGIEFYFLSHFHSDHYHGLNSKFKKALYCSRITANLVNLQLKVSLKYINVLPIDEPILVGKTEVILMESNHCPGAVMFLFRLSNGRNILHTGDFRAHPDMESSILKDRRIHTLYLDTTYCQPKYIFPSQSDVVDFGVSVVRRKLNEDPKTLIVCGSYTIGKEKIFNAIAKKLGLKVWVDGYKLKILSCLDDNDMMSRMSRDWTAAQVHILSMQKLSFKALQEHLRQLKDKFTNILAIRPTGWEYRKNVSLEDLKPRCYNNVSIYGLPYSEHSSFAELKRFVQFIKAEKIIPTVNVGKIDERNRMQQIFSEWMKEKI